MLLMAHPGLGNRAYRQIGVNVVRRSIVLARLGEFNFAALTFHWSRTNCPMHPLYPGPCFAVLPRRGTMLSRINLDLDFIPNATSAAFASIRSSVFAGIVCADTPINRDKFSGSARTHDSTSRTATLNNRFGCLGDDSHSAISSAGHIYLSRSVRTKNGVPFAAL